ncbi:MULTISPECIES: HNH endonuclease [Vibrio]|uniref:HNH endonuclease n=2 Tax=Vibrio TaxID=662 RepID=A0A4V5R3H4_9VIBR|nr:MULTISPECIES: HNH endonuclease [Vibrio]OBS95075.1 hypothetical protein A9259_13170 [Vibrio cyclitrophicus]TKF26398.1 HNH endonuclease [Vibrio kanaloae]SBT11349.1 hypothetical protein VCE7224_00065 [Vibrio celticus]
MTHNSTKIAQALKELSTSSSKKIQNGIKMLKANYRAEDRKITAIQLAKAAGYENYMTGNEQYGSFAHELSLILQHTPEQQKNGVPIWTYTICTAADETNINGHFTWVLKDQVAEALEELKWVTPIAPNNVITDLEMMQAQLDTLSEKDREITIQARIGQGLFRSRLIHHWTSCSVTGFDNTDFLVASHIKPWRDCSASEAIDMTNGLLLTPNLDTAFDKGYISFDRDGLIMLSPQLTSNDVEKLNISPTMKLRWCFPQHDHFLQYHRKHIFRKDS